MHNIEHDCKLNDTPSIRSRECEEEEVVVIVRDDGCDADDYVSGDTNGIRSMLKQANDNEDKKEGDERDDRKEGDEDKEGDDDFHDVDSTDHINHHNDEEREYYENIIDTASSSSAPTATRNSFINTTAEVSFFLLHGDGDTIIEEESKEKDSSLQDFLHEYNNSNNYKVNHNNNYQGNNNKSYQANNNDINSSSSNNNSSKNSGIATTTNNTTTSHHLNDNKCKEESTIQVARRGSRSYLSCFSSGDGDHDDHTNDHGDRYDHYHHQQPPLLESCMYQRMSGNSEDSRTKKKTDVFGSSCVIA